MIFQEALATVMQLMLQNVLLHRYNYLSKVLSRDFGLGGGKLIPHGIFLGWPHPFFHLEPHS